MRTDLTAAFIAAKNSSSRKPRQLLVFQFPVVGNVYISDQEITLGGHTYQALVENWGTLVDSSGAESDFTAETRQMSVTLWNGGSSPFSGYFLKEDPENVEVLLYQWFDGLADADKLLLDRFVVQDPIQFDEASRLLTLDLVSINQRYVAKCGGTVTTALWPKALAEHVGQAIPLIFGAAGECNTLCVKTAPKATLYGSIAPKSTTIECNESLAAFPASGILQIEEEQIQYSSRTDKMFTVSVRGYGGTTKTSHPDNAEVHQLITDHTYLLGELPIASVTGVRVDGYPAPAGTYSIDLTGTYGKVIFNQKPYSYQFTASGQPMELFNFFIATDNTAWQAHYAYDANRTSSSALINEVYPILSIETAAGALADQGLITTAYLTVHHWETNTYLNDYVEVWVEGIGVVGRLARPSVDDIFQLDAEVDVDHPHDHVTGDHHTHPHSDGSYGANASGHLHPLDGDGTQITGECSYAWPAVIEPPMNGSTYITANYTFYNIPSGALYTNSFLRFRAYLASVRVVVSSGGVTLGDWDYRASGAGSVDTSFQFIGQGGIKITVYGSNVVGAYASIKEATLTWNFDATMQNAADQVSPYLTSSGSNAQTYNTNSPDDVLPLLTENREIEIISQKSPSRTLVDRFDLSDFIDPTWAWFAGRKVQVRYVGTANDVNVFIPWICFEVEYRKRERVYSDRVTATVSGNASRRPDQVLQTLLGKAGLPSNYIDTTSFSAAGTWFATNGYTIDGVIDGGLPVGEAIKTVCWQSRARLYWGGGKAKLAIRKKPADWSIAKYLTPDNYQLRSIRATRQSVQDLVNSIELFYSINRCPENMPYLIPAGKKGGSSITTQGQPYLASVIKQDAGSIAAHGLREQRDAYMCDLVRSSSMAASLADYYLATLAYPSTIYEFNTYLEQAEIEKEDIIALTSAGFHKIRKMPLRIKEVARLFGSGKNRTINHLRFIAECLRYVLIEQGLADQVLLLDSLNATIGRLIDLEDHIHAQDELTAAEEALLAEEIMVEDALETIWAMTMELVEDMSVTDELAIGVNIILQEQVNLLDQVTPWRGVGFGSGDFGIIGFGGVTSWGESNPDEVFAFEQAASGMNVSVHIDSEFGWLEEWIEYEWPLIGWYFVRHPWWFETDTGIVTITDELALSTGYGSPGTISSGFAAQPFGR
jgi:hypothetical protein